MARPKKDINWELVEKRMEAGNSAATIAEMHHIDINTFYNRFKEYFGANFADYSDKFHQCGKSNIAFTQYIKALGGNTNMLTLLGREWLGQGAIKEEIPRNDEIMSFRHENMLLRAELAEVKEKLNGITNSSSQPEARKEFQRSDTSV